MINAIVCSKDRPMQLYALLDSIKNNSNNIFNKVKVLYTSSGEAYNEGYGIVRASFRACEFYEESRPFKDEYESLFELDTPAHCLFVDDMIFFRENPLSQKNILDYLNKEDISMFSLRLGLNTTCQQIGNKRAKYSLVDYIDDGVSICWNRTLVQPWYNYNYPLSVDGCIYRTHQIYSLISREQYKNLNELEALLYTESYKMPKMITSCKFSCCVGIPFNLVQSTMDNPTNKVNSFSAKELNEMFLRGQRMDWRRMNFSGVDSTHCDIAPQFTNEDKIMIPSFKQISVEQANRIREELLEEMSEKVSKIYWENF